MADVKYWEKIPARPTTYNGIQMRSRLEAAFAARIDANGCAWQYEPRCFADGTGQYLPDFYFVYEDKVSGMTLDFYAEVKPDALSPTEVEEAKLRMEIILRSEPDACLLLYLGSKGHLWAYTEDAWGESV